MTRMNWEAANARERGRNGEPVVKAKRGKKRGRVTASPVRHWRRPGRRSSHRWGGWVSSGAGQVRRECWKCGAFEDQK